MSNNKKKTQNPMAKLALQRLKLVEEENARIKALQEEEERKIREEEEKEKARLKAIQDEKDKKRKAKEDKIKSQKEAGTYKTKSQKDRDKKIRLKLELMQKSGIVNESGQIIMSSAINTQNIDENESEDEIEESNFRSPIMCIMGHVDAGKTSLLDNIRNTNVQNGEAGGITQQIGASFIPENTLISKSRLEKSHIRVPGILMIDTPGHEAFANLRQRGSSLCDIAIVVIDFMNGLQQQTIQSINMLIESNIKFVFALNKIDRLYGWKTTENKTIQEAIQENSICNDEFNHKLSDIITQIMSIGVNAKLYWENNSVDDTISICPISARTSEGISDLLTLVLSICQNDISNQITFNEELECTVVEKTINETIGSSIDVILKNGILNKGDVISFQTIDGIQTTTIKNLLTPPPNRESRVKTEYIHHLSVKGSMGVKIVANDIDKALIGTQISFKPLEEVQAVISTIQLQDVGVTVFSSCQGSLEAFVNYLQKECKDTVPVSNVSIGSITKKFISKFLLNKNDKKEYNTILAFNVEVDSDAQELADKNEIKIFTSEIIYQLYDLYQKFRIDVIKERKDFYRPQAVFPCTLKILEKHIYNKKHPLVFGVTILEGNLHIGTPIIAFDNKTYIGRVTSIQLNNSNVNIAKCGTDVCIKVENDQNPNIMYGRQFDHKNNICSLLSRTSIDVIKNHFRDEASIDDAKLIVKLKKILSII